MCNFWNSKIFNVNGIKCKKINKVNQGSPHIVESSKFKKNIALVINTGGGKRTR